MITLQVVALVSHDSACQVTARGMEVAFRNALPGVLLGFEIN